MFPKGHLPQELTSMINKYAYTLKYASVERRFSSIKLVKNNKNNGLPYASYKTHLGDYNYFISVHISDFETGIDKTTISILKIFKTEDDHGYYNEISYETY